MPLVRLKRDTHNNLLTVRDLLQRDSKSRVTLDDVVRNILIVATQQSIFGKGKKAVGYEWRFVPVDDPDDPEDT